MNFCTRSIYTHTIVFVYIYIYAYKIIRRKDDQNKIIEIFKRKCGARTRRSGNFIQKLFQQCADYRCGYLAAINVKRIIQQIS